MRGFVILLALIGLAVGGWYGVRTYAPQHLPDQWTTDEVLQERVRAEIMTDPHAAAFLATFERQFPADSEELTSRLVAIYRDGGSAEQAATFVESYMNSFVRDNRRHIATASAADLTALLSALSEATRLVGAENVDMCAHMFTSGDFSAPLEGLSDETKTALVGVTTAMLESIASGMRTPTQHARPTEAQAIAWLQRFEAAGGNARVAQAFGTSDVYGLSTREVCDAATIMWSSALTAEDDFAPRFVSFSFSQRP